MHEIEREIIKVTGYKVKRKFSDREDYLKSLLNDAMKLSDDDFDNMTDEAAAWINAAVDAHNSKSDSIPDFDEVDEVEASEDDENEPDDESESDSDESDESENEDPEEASEDEALEDEPEAEEAIDEPVDEDEPAPKPTKKKVAAKEKAPKVPPKVQAKPKVEPKRSPKTEDAVLDKWSCIEGSKNSQALAMFERGATTKEVKEELHGTYYNLLKRMEQNGHKLEKEGAVIKLTHKDASKPPIKKKK